MPRSAITGRCARGSRAGSRDQDPAMPAEAHRQVVVWIWVDFSCRCEWNGGKRDGKHAKPPVLGANGSSGRDATGGQAGAATDHQQAPNRCIYCKTRAAIGARQGCGPLEHYASLACSTSQFCGLPHLIVPSPKITAATGTTNSTTAASTSHAGPGVRAVLPDPPLPPAGALAALPGISTCQWVSENAFAQQCATRTAVRQGLARGSFHPPPEHPVTALKEGSWLLGA